MSRGHWVVLSATSISRTDRINVEPTTLCNARRVMYSFAARLEANGAAIDMRTDYWLSETGEICEGIHWRQKTFDGIEDFEFMVHIASASEREIFEDRGQPWTRG